MKNLKWTIRPLFVSLLSFISVLCFAQDPTDSIPDDPGSISVYTIQHMGFGAFSQGATGGSVVIDTDGSRSVTGTVVGFGVGASYAEAIFEILAIEGTIISISNGADATLTGSNGGTMSLEIGGSDPASPFSTTVSPPTRTQVHVGGTLTVGNSTASPPGTYSGTLYITFNQE